MQAIQCLWFVEDRFSDNWRLEVNNWSAFVDAVGSDVLTHFARCFVHADRLMSLATLVYLSQQQFGEESVTFKRDLQTAVWLAAGTVREFTLASMNLRGALANRGLFNAESKHWAELRELEMRWNDDPHFRELRNEIAFHVDRDVVERGINALRENERVVVIEGEGPKQGNASAHLGIYAAICGRFDGTASEGDMLAEFKKTMRSLGEDDVKPIEIVHELFLEVVLALGFEPLRMQEARARSASGGA